MAAQRVSVFSALSIEGLHHWPGAGSKASEPYLAKEHRHLFKIRLESPVRHTDRDVEFISFGRMVRRAMLRTFGPEPCQFKTMSCEDIGLWIMDAFPQVSLAEVSEDGENGAIVRRK